MPRYKLTLEYDGAPFVGWQRQANGPSVQGALEAALFALCGEAIVAYGAGRTDAGVHASGQVAHVDLVKSWDGLRLREALNAHLAPQPIAVLRAEQVEADFDARHSARMRHYVYRIVNRRAPLTFERGRAWHVKRALDADAMNAAAKALLGRHDFSTFRDSQCQAASPVRTLTSLEVARVDDLIEMRVSALSFLHRQVRSMVGSLEHVGAGYWSAADLKSALEAADRSRCGQVAPACGLYLARVDYA
ncbi:tRNA pseudouridine(38-40) synthase TruA [Methylocapsa sp. S129]|uniref:tRNA pseudouridine(38-40) synthase TruA n=1 Tax=Methylocapsa sp. S129 TaxID=1641869 RepID=UPI00131C6230|nr:tRNA pseudouridine(38-40) synthase TruA [Methylocapsa sp. S129]